jgi:hypothetical protein
VSFFACIIHLIACWAKEHTRIPEINEGVMAGDGPFKSVEEFQKPLGFPGEKVDNWQEVAINHLLDCVLG